MKIHALSALLLSFPFFSGIALSAEIRLNEVLLEGASEEQPLQFIELAGPPESPLHNHALLLIQGDTSENPGEVLRFVPLDGLRMDPRGLLLLENPGPLPLLPDTSASLLLVSIDDPENLRNLDLDPANSGRLELPAGTAVIDAVSWVDRPGHLSYTVPEQSVPASFGIPHALTRLNSGQWTWGDLVETGAPLTRDGLFYDHRLAPRNLPAHARLTPGEPNVPPTPFALLNEILLNGTTRIELLSHPGAILRDARLRIISHNNHPVPPSQDLTIPQTPFSHKGILLLEWQLPTAISHHKDGFTLQLLSSSRIIDSLALRPSAIPLENPPFAHTVLSFHTSKPNLAVRFADTFSAHASDWFFGIHDSTYDLLRRDLNSSNAPEAARPTPGKANFTAVTGRFVPPLLETEPTTVGYADADDPAFWFNAQNPSASLVIATQKNAGFSVYDREGKTLLDAGPENVRYNNVDVIYGFSTPIGPVDLALFSDRVSDRIQAYRIEPDSPYLTNLTAPGMPVLFHDEPEERTSYGLCAYHDPKSAKAYVFVTQNGTYAWTQVELTPTPDGLISGRIVRRGKLTAGDPDQHAEGMVVDPFHRQVLIIQEETGIYRLPLDPASQSTSGELDTGPSYLVARADNNRLFPDIEGITLYDTGDGDGYFIVSSQGSNTFAVYTRKEFNYLGSFAVTPASPALDGSEDCDGLDVTNRSWGPAFPAGALIVHDGRNTRPGDPNFTTNFKWIPWHDVARSFSPPLRHHKTAHDSPFTQPSGNKKTR